jgi:hypothetical protein
MIIDWNRGKYSQTTRFLTGIVLGVYLGAAGAPPPVGPRVFIKKVGSRSILGIKTPADQRPPTISLTVREVPL